METDAAARFCEYLPPVFDISVCFGIHRSPHDLLGRSIGGRRCAYIQLIPDEAGWLKIMTVGNEPKNDVFN